VLAVRRNAAVDTRIGGTIADLSHPNPLLAQLKSAAEKEDPMTYVDGFIVAVPKKNLEAYREMASKAGAVWREYGALSYVECIADDVKPGKLTSFPQAVQLEPDEVVAFAWVTYKSRAQRDAINEKVMKDPRLAGMMDPNAPIFDGKRMIFGGFETIVDL